MATKKKAAKPAKKPTNVKKIVPAKKAAAKPAHSSGAAKSAARKAPVSKSIAKPVAKKVAPVSSAKKTVNIPPKKSVVSNMPNASKPAQKLQPAHPPVSGAAKQTNPVSAGKPVPKEEPKKSVLKTPEKKEEPKPVPVPPPVSVKPEPKKPVVPPKPAKIVIPEMKTKTVRKYEPEFTKSVLDTPQEEQTGPTMRYSDAELGEFRDLINRKLDAAKKELAYLQGLITRKDEMGGDNDDARYMTMEDGSMSMEREQLSQMASRQITFIDHLEKAIMRIENKTYGICRVTGKLIDKARLRAVPHATLSIEAKQMMNK
ncbi:MAG: TraR/DksA C4-type zinc finger protein [Bacteroidota bacterium]